MICSIFLLGAVDSMLQLELELEMKLKLKLKLVAGV